MRADVHFVVKVCESWQLQSCAAKQDQEARGLFGFHRFESCPNCVRTFNGWKLWGENGHCQGNAKDRADLAHLLRRMASRPWPMKDGRLMGFRFRRGSREFYS